MESRPILEALAFNSSHEKAGDCKVCSSALSFSSLLVSYVGAEPPLSPPFHPHVELARVIGQMIWSNTLVASCVVRLVSLKIIRPIAYLELFPRASPRW